MPQINLKSPKTGIGGAATADTLSRDSAFQLPRTPTPGDQSELAILYLEPEKIRVTDFSRNTRTSRKLFNARTVPVLAIGLEFFLVGLANFAAAELYHRSVHGQSVSINFYLYSACFLAFLFCIPCGINRDHSVSQIGNWRKQVQSVFLHWNSAYLIFSFALFISHATVFYSRGALLTQYFAGFAAAALFRLIAGRLIETGLRRQILGGRRTMLIGDNASVGFIKRRLHRRSPGIDLVGLVTFSPRNCSRHEANASGAPYVHKTKAAIEDLARRTNVDEIILVIPYAEVPHMERLIDELAIVPATVHLAPDVSAPWSYQLPRARVGTLPTLRLLRGPMTLRDRIIKRCFDLVVSSLLILVALPLFVILGFMIKLDSKGPVFFRQRRHGFNQDEFRIFKFRTMTTLDDGPKISQATRDDERVTRMGRYLRRTNLDELPQLFNVLFGQMSLVGPRPHAVAHNDEFEEKIRLYAKRHNVKPGITGWSQVNGLRGETDTIDKMQRRVHHDIHYIDNWSIWFDIYIMFFTIFSAKSYRNAY
jgi:Undecaprenyl-phosphate glucose phosphotransferase